MGSAPSLLSMVSVTSARPSGGREVVPAKTTSSILPPRRDFTPCSPITQDRASTTLDLPEPFGPTTQVMPGSRWSDVAEANDLKPRRVRLFRYTCRHFSPLSAPSRPAAGDQGNPAKAGASPGCAQAKLAAGPDGNVSAAMPCDDWHITGRYTTKRGTSE